MIELQVVSNCRHLTQYCWAVANKSRSFYRRRDVAVFDEVRFTRGKYKLSTCDIDLTSAELDRIQTLLDGLDDVFGRGLARHHQSVRHARYGAVVVTLTASIPSHRQLHQPRAQALLQ